MKPQAGEIITWISPLVYLQCSWRCSQVFYGLNCYSNKWLYHCNEIKWPLMRLKTPTSRLFVQQLVHANNRISSWVSITNFLSVNPLLMGGSSQRVSNVESLPCDDMITMHMKISQCCYILHVKHMNVCIVTRYGLYLPSHLKYQGSIIVLSFLHPFSWYHSVCEHSQKSSEIQFSSMSYVPPNMHEMYMRCVNR